MIISLIAAVGENNIIGANGDLPWSLPDDMKFFSKTTRGHHVLMGRKNYDSIPEKYRPLPGRPNIVVTRNRDFTDDAVLVANSIEEGIAAARAAGESELFIIGGGEIYRQTIAQADRLYLTHVHASPEGETYFPEFRSEEWRKKTLTSHPKDDVHNFSFEICVYYKNDSN
ncbi:MAG: dihydrofolate reductase [Cryomorphaceae bacterium]